MWLWIPLAAIAIVFVLLGLAVAYILIFKPTINVVNAIQ